MSSAEYIVSGIEASSLPPKVQEMAVEFIRECPSLEKRCQSLFFIPPDGQRGAYYQLTAATIDLLTPMLANEGVSPEQGQNLWSNIYCQFTGEDPQMYLE